MENQLFFDTKKKTVLCWCECCFQCRKLCEWYIWHAQNLFTTLTNLISMKVLRGPAPKKRPMTSSSKIQSADFYLPSRGYRILFKNDFLLFQFRFKPKISSRKLFPSDSSKIRPKISPRKKRFRNHYRNAK